GTSISTALTRSASTRRQRRSRAAGCHTTSRKARASSFRRCTEPGMYSSTSTEERAALAEAVRDFATAKLAPHASEWDAEKHFPIETLREAGEMGLGGVYVREESGGSGLSRLDAVAIFEELAQGDTTIAAYI